MASTFMDIVKDNKKPLLSMLGILVMAIIIAISYSSGGAPTLDGGLGNLDNINNNNNMDNNSSAPAMQLGNYNYSAKIKTNYGDIVIDLFEDDAPITVNSFVYLSEKGFYDNLTFHRIIRDFVIQGGDPQGTGMGGPGYKFDDEIDADAIGLGKLKVYQATFLRSFYSLDVLDKYKNESVKDFYQEYAGYKYIDGQGSKQKFVPYVLAMANSGPNTNGSQFFITTKNSNTEYLDGKHTVFGKITSGFDVVDKIESVNTDSQGKPTSSVKILSIDIVKN